MADKSNVNRVEKEELTHYLETMWKADEDITELNYHSLMSKFSWVKDKKERSFSTLLDRLKIETMAKPG